MEFVGQPKRRSHLLFDLKWSLLLVVALVICLIFIDTRYNSVALPAVVLAYMVGWIYDGIRLARNNKRAGAKFKFPDSDRTAK